MSANSNGQATGLQARRGISTKFAGGPPVGGHRLTGQAQVFLGTGKQAACQATGARL